MRLFSYEFCINKSYKNKRYEKLLIIFMKFLKTNDMSALSYFDLPRVLWAKRCKSFDMKYGKLSNILSKLFAPKQATGDLCRLHYIFICVRYLRFLLMFWGFVSFR